MYCVAYSQVRDLFAEVDPVIAKAWAVWFKPSIAHQITAGQRPFRGPLSVFGHLQSTAARVSDRRTSPIRESRWPPIHERREGARALGAPSDDETHRHQNMPMPNWSPLAKATRALVVVGPSYDDVLAEQRRKRRSRSADGPRVLLDEQDLDGVRALVSILSDTVPGAAGMDWMEWHQLLIVLLDRDQVVREIGVLGRAGWTRDAEHHDLPLVNPEALDAWLLARGVDLPNPPDRGDR